MPPAASVPPEPPRRIALLFAVRRELAPLARLLRPARAPAPRLAPYPCFFGSLGGALVLAAAGGVGARRAEEAAGDLLDAWRPDLLVMAGVAGALAPGLRVGEIVAAESVETEGGSLLPDVPGSRIAAGLGPGVTAGALLSVDRVLVTAEEKRAAASRPGPGGDPLLAVEMETAGMARAAAARGVRWAAARAISDTAAESLPLDFNRLRAADGDLPAGRVALVALSRPRCIPGLVRLAGNTGAAADGLAGFLERWIRSGLT